MLSYIYLHTQMMRVFLITLFDVDFSPGTKVRNHEVHRNSYAYMFIIGKKIYVKPVFSEGFMVY
jgi:hypothetical protein